MPHTLTFVVLLIAVSVKHIVRGIPVTEKFTKDSCAAKLSSYDSYPCSRTVTIFGQCNSSTLDLAQTSIARCTAIHLSWSNPIENLTMIIETPFTAEQQSYTIHIDNEGMMGPVSHVFRLIEGEEIEITTNGSKLIQYADANYQVILKFRSPTEFNYYGVFIDYEVYQA